MAEETIKSEMSLTDSALIARAKARREDGEDAMRHNFDAATVDLKFCNNEDHWNAEVKADREEAGLSCLVFNDALPYLRDVKGEQKQSRPHTTIKPIGSGATSEVATIKEDYLRARKFDCKADEAYDHAFNQQVEGGFGYFSIVTEFEPGSFDQRFAIKPILNQNAVIFDQNAEEWHKNDGEWMMRISHMDKEVLEKKYGPPVTDFDDTDKAWYPLKNQVTVAEYFEKVHFQKTIYQLNTGEVFEKKNLELPEGIAARVGAEWPNPEYDPATVKPSLATFKIVKTRKVDDYKIYRYLLCGHKVLEPKEEWPCKYWPDIPVEGEKKVIGGRIYFKSLIWAAKDAIKAKNLSRCTEIDTLAMVPKTPLGATPAMMEGFGDLYDNSHKRMTSWLPYNPDPMMPGAKPAPLSAIDPGHIQALVQSSMEAKEDIRSAIGPNTLLPRAANAMPVTSGTALSRWQKEGDIATFIFQDNLQKAIEWGDLVCVELMARIMDTERTITCRKGDGSSYDVKINEEKADPGTMQVVKSNDFLAGDYTAETTLGPSYTAQRAEIGDKMLLFVQTIPSVAAATADLLASMLFDMGQTGQSGGILDEFTKRIRRLNFKAGMIDPSDLKEEELKDYQELIAERQKPPEMPPDAMAKLRTETARAMKLAAEAEKAMADTAQIKAGTSQQLMEQLMQQITLIGQMAMGPQAQPTPEPQPGTGQPSQPTEPGVQG